MECHTYGPFLEHSEPIPPQFDSNDLGHSWKGVQKHKAERCSRGSETECSRTSVLSSSSITHAQPPDVHTHKKNRDGMGRVSHMNGGQMMYASVCMWEMGVR